MGIEPAAANCIRRYKREVYGATAQRFLVFLLVALTASGFSFFLAWVSVHWFGETWLGFLIPSTLMLVLMLSVNVDMGVVSNRYHRRVSSSTKRPSEYDSRSLARFQSAVDALSIRAGISSPTVVPIDIRTANAFTVRCRGHSYIAVSRELLDLGLGHEEVEAVMAHELAHILTGTGIPSSLTLGSAIGLVSLLISMLIWSLALFLGAWFLGWLLPALTGISVGAIYSCLQEPSPLFAVHGSGFRLPRHDVYSLRDTVADSIAATMTSDPTTLSRTILKLAGEMEHSTEMPDELLAEHLFVAPLKPWTPVFLEDVPDYDPAVFDTSAVASRRVWKSLIGVPYWRMREDVNTMNLEQQMVEYIDEKRKSLSSRLQNLEEIRNGYWQAFETTPITG